MGHDFRAKRGKKGEIDSQNKATDNSITRPHPERREPEQRGRARQKLQTQSGLMSFPCAEPIVNEDIKYLLPRQGGGYSPEAVRQSDTAECCNILSDNMWRNSGQITFYYVKDVDGDSVEYNTLSWKWKSMEIYHARQNPFNCIKSIKCVLCRYYKSF